MIKYLLKWFILVWLSSTLSFHLGLEKANGNSYFIAGMVAGVCVFVVLYAILDSFFAKIGDELLSKSLLISVFIKMVCQILVLPEIFAGWIALRFTRFFLGELTSTGNHFLFAFISTVLTGLFLSVLVIVLTGIIDSIGSVINSKNKIGHNQT